MKQWYRVRVLRMVCSTTIEVSDSLKQIELYYNCNVNCVNHVY